jgi:hypothetical protein
MTCRAALCCSLFALSSASCVSDAAPSSARSETRQARAPSASGSISGPLVKATQIELAITDKAGRTSQTSVKEGAFDHCLATAQGGERGYALFSVRMSESEPTAATLIESEGLSTTTSNCLTAAITAHRDAFSFVRDTVWYFGVK